jgi:hypothetical protein
MGNHFFEINFNPTISNHQIHPASELLPGIFSAFTLSSLVGSFDTSGYSFTCFERDFFYVQFNNRIKEFMVTLFMVAVFNRFINNYLYNPKT